MSRYREGRKTSNLQLIHSDKPGDGGSHELEGRRRGASLCRASDCRAHLEPVLSRAGHPMHAGMGSCPQRKTKVQLEETESRDRAVPRQQAVTLILDFLVVVVRSQMWPHTLS